MTGIAKQAGPTARNVAGAIKRWRRAANVTTAELSRRLAALGQPVPDTSITKTEQGTRKVDVDDLTAFALALGITPNVLLLPEVGFLGAGDDHHVTPAVTATSERLWQWAQGERPLSLDIPGAEAWLGPGENPDTRFSVRTRPYLTALHAEQRGRPGHPDPPLRAITTAVLDALDAGATPAQVRRVAELAIVLRVVMSGPEVERWLKDGTRPGKEGS